jgi:hypothetical protein
MNELGRSSLTNNRNAAPPAKVSSLVAPVTGDWGSVTRFANSVIERLDMREGARGSPLEKSVLKRDLEDRLKQLGLIPPTATPPGGGALVVGPNGQYAYKPFEAFARDIFDTNLWKNLSADLSDPHRFDDLPAQVRAIVSVDIASVAKTRGADIQRLDQKVQSLQESLALTVTELTASFQGSAAGVRETMWAWANDQRASAGKITQVQARLDNFSGGAAGTATVEQKMTAVADRATGLEAQYTVKVATNGAWAGIGLASTTNIAGNATSVCIIAANKFALVDSTESIANPLAPAVNRIPFGVDLTNDTIYINGAVRINSGGTRLDQLGKSLAVTAPTQVFKQNSTGTWDATSITLTATKNGGMSGSVVWTVVSGTYTGSLTGSSGTGTLSGTLSVVRANMTTAQVTFRASVTDGSKTFTDDMTVVQLVDGVNSITAFLTNEAVTLPASSGGVVSDFSTATGTLRVFQGTTEVTGTASFSVRTNTDNLTAAITSAGVYSVTAAGGWANGSVTTSVTLRAVFGGVTIDKVFVLTKSNAGTAGAAGTRGTLSGYSKLFSLYLSGVNDSADPWPLTGTAAQTTNAFRANAIISNMITGGALTSVSTTSHLLLGDEVTLTDSATPTRAETRMWNGFNWIKPGTVIDGNLIVTGTASASAITAGEILTGNASSKSKISIGNYNAFSSITAAMLVTKTAVQADHVMVAARNGVDDSVPIWGLIYNGATTATSSNAVSGTWASGNSPELWKMIGTLGSSLASASVWGRAYDAAYSGGHFEFTTSSAGTISGATITKRVKLATSAYAAFSDTGEGKQYFKDGAGPFTGFHPALAPRGGTYTQGDIVVDVRVIEKPDVSNALTLVEVSSAQMQPAALGVINDQTELTIEASPDIVSQYGKSHILLYVNGVGEGCINVCGEGGDIAAGDLIVTSSMPGKGMRQADDVVHSYTVAKARESAVFDDPGQVMQIACAYLSS